MINVGDLLALDSATRDKQVLSVYIKAAVANPADGRAWMIELDELIARERRRLRDVFPVQLRAFDESVALLRESLPGSEIMHEAQGWVGFFQADRIVATQEMPTVAQTVVAWDDKPRLLPLYQALERDSVVYVALADKQHVRIIKVTNDHQEEVCSVRAHTRSGPMYHAHFSSQGHFHPGVRGSTGADQSARARREATRHMLHAAVTCIERQCDDDSWLVLGGSAEATNMLLNLLPQQLRERTLNDPALGMRASLNSITSAAEADAELMRLVQAEQQVGSLVGLSSVRRRAVGLPQTFSALKDRAVRSLYISNGFITSHPSFAEEVVRMALTQGAELRTVSGPFAEQLDTYCDGIAARLRYAIVRERAAS